MLGIDTQLLCLAVMFLTGAALALFHDLCGVLSGTTPAPGAAASRRRTLAGRRPILRPWDIVFCLLVTPVVFAAVLVSNRGELRLYVFLGLAAGLGAYTCLAAPLVRTAAAGLRDLAVRVLRAAGATLARPLQAAVRTAAAGARLLTGAGRRLTGAGCRAGTALLRRVGRTASGPARLGRRLLAGFRRRAGE